MTDKKKVGRPQKDITVDQFEKLCNMQCTLEEIAGFFDCCDDTINNWCKKTYGDNFSGVFKSKSVGGKISLRRNQFKLSEKNASMAIFLGKQYLGQKDMPELEEKSNGVLDELTEALRNAKNS